AEDLVFTYAERDDVVKKLKHLDSRIGALNYIINENGEKRAMDTIFIKTLEQDRGRQITQAGLGSAIKQMNQPPQGGAGDPACPRYINAVISFHRHDSPPNQKEHREAESLTIRISFLYEVVSERKVESANDFYIEEKMIEGRPYKIEVLKEGKRVIYTQLLEAKEKMDILI
ncbi:MAG: hypothetical protein QXK65_03385, partial [Candidatus Micrarchaeaceae archaeon]